MLFWQPWDCLLLLEIKLLDKTVTITRSSKSFIENRACANKNFFLRQQIINAFAVYLSHKKVVCYLEKCNILI